MKLYVHEPGSDAMEEIVSRSAEFGVLYVSELSTVEVVSAIAKSVRERRLREREATVQCLTLAEDLRDTFFMVYLDSYVLARASNILQRHGLRSRIGTGDSIQLACAEKVGTEMRPPIFTLVASDGGFSTVARAMGHQVWDPETHDVERLRYRHVGDWP